MMAALSPGPALPPTRVRRPPRLRGESRVGGGPCTAVVGLAVAWSAAFGLACRQEVPDPPRASTAAPVVVVPTEETPGTDADPVVPGFVFERPTSLRIFRVDAISQLAAADPSALARVTALDLSFSAADRLEDFGLGTTDPTVSCQGLDLTELVERVPAVTHLRLSGCQEAAHVGLGAFGAQLRSLELADLGLDAVTVARIAQLTELNRLSLHRVYGTSASVLGLASLPIEALSLTDLGADVPSGTLLSLWPNTLEHLHLEGPWAQHETSLELPDLRRLRVLELANTKIGNFSLNQIKGLPALTELSLVGPEYNGRTPLYLRDLPLERFTCDCPQFSDAGLANLRHVASIRALWLPRSTVTSAGLATLSTKHKNLETLVLRDRPLDERGLLALAAFPRLSYLELGAGTTQMSTFRGLAGVTSLTTLVLRYEDLDDRVGPELGALTNLVRLDLSGTKVSDTCLPHLGGLSKLEQLDLSRTRVTNAGLAALATLTRLSSLDLAHTDLVDPALVHVARLTSLRELSLAGTLVTDRGLTALGPLQALERLDLRDTVVSDDARATLRTLPRLTEVALRPPARSAPGLREGVTGESPGAGP